MKKLLMLIVAVLFVVEAAAQEKDRNSIAMEVSLEWITNGSPGTGTYKVSSFVNKKISVQYRYYAFERVYVEPGLSYYSMNYDYYKSTGSGISVDVNDPANGKYRYSNSILDEIGVAISTRIGFSIPLSGQLSLDLYIMPDYRIAIDCKGKLDADLIEEDIFKRGYFMLGGGAALNYGKIFASLSCGTYLTDRYLKKSAADKPVCLTVGIGYRF